MQKQQAAVSNVLKSIGFKTLLAITLITGAYALRWSVLELQSINTSAMVPSYAQGTYALVLRCAYQLRLPFISQPLISFRSPQRGDVVALHLPYDASLVDVRRVVALAGDTVVQKDGVLYINGERHSEHPHQGNWPADGQPFPVPEDAVFVLGDDPSNTSDSRAWGKVPLWFIRGRVL